MCLVEIHKRHSVGQTRFSRLVHQSNQTRLFGFTKSINEKRCDCYWMGKLLDELLFGLKKFIIWCFAKGSPEFSGENEISRLRQVSTKIKSSSECVSWLANQMAFCADDALSFKKFTYSGRNKKMCHVITFFIDLFNQTQTNSIRFGLRVIKECLLYQRRTTCFT